MPRLAAIYLCKKWRCELGFNCTLWNMRKSCLVYLDPVRYLWFTLRLDNFETPEAGILVYFGTNLF
jgi:hypothetical protein